MDSRHANNALNVETGLRALPYDMGNPESLIFRLVILRPPNKQNTAPFRLPWLYGRLRTSHCASDVSIPLSWSSTRLSATWLLSVRMAFVFTKITKIAVPLAKLLNASWF